jgi:hypothetical protein
MNLYSLGCKFKLKFKLLKKFELYSFELTKFYCIMYDIPPNDKH